ncbi:MAG: hypothetical protein VYA34_10435 [Myxococcota bacterium]|nr:hypothetical protein [Myxococcota bacterium]
MLDAFIIEELKRRERRKKELEAGNRPRLELPVHPDEQRDRESEVTDEPEHRTVTLLV